MNKLSPKTGMQRRNQTKIEQQTTAIYNLRDVNMENERKKTLPNRNKSI